MTAQTWTATTDALPANGSRVLCFIPEHSFFLPGKSGEVELREVVIMRFAEDFFLHNPSKTGYSGAPHFWLGEGTSNRFFAEVSHWQALPQSPEGAAH